MKMDFLPFATVRADPVINPSCLSDHVHTFYGSIVAPHPSTSYENMRNATANRYASPHLLVRASVTSSMALSSKKG